MEDNKYYTPEISEIYFGFQFEVYNSKERFMFEGEDGWYKTTMDFGVLGNIANLQRLILDKQIRVPYLSKEDIEAEGFEYAGPINGYENKKDHLFLELENGKVIIMDGTATDSEYFLFRGTIKNRSELKKVLKMIGV